ncbi:MAG: hypothetical protein J7641_09350 [Cyanobacteria bacterium SID2]|nr:hypothetical protein [Cyanobacteria bacterium SID2]
MTHSTRQDDSAEMTIDPFDRSNADNPFLNENTTGNSSTKSPSPERLAIPAKPLSYRDLVAWARETERDWTGHWSATQHRFAELELEQEARLAAERRRLWLEWGLLIFVILAMASLSLLRFLPRWELAGRSIQTSEEELSVGSSPTPTPTQFSASPPEDRTRKTPRSTQVPQQQTSSSTPPIDRSSADSLDPARGSDTAVSDTIFSDAVRGWDSSTAFDRVDEPSGESWAQDYSWEREAGASEMGTGTVPDRPTDDTRMTEDTSVVPISPDGRNWGFAITVADDAALYAVGKAGAKVTVACGNIPGEGLMMAMTSESLPHYEFRALNLSVCYPGVYQAGEPVATVASGGEATGDRFYWDVRWNGQSIDPPRWSIESVLKRDFFVDSYSKSEN